MRLRTCAIILVDDGSGPEDGGRFEGAVPFRSRFGNTLTRELVRILLGQRIQDTKTGLRGLPVTLLPYLLRFDLVGHEFKLDMLITAARSSRYASILTWTVITQGSHYVDQFVGRLGWLTVRFPGWLVAAYLTVLMVVGIDAIAAWLVPAFRPLVALPARRSLESKVWQVISGWARFGRGRKHGGC